MTNEHPSPSERDRVEKGVCGEKIDIVDVEPEAVRTGQQGSDDDFEPVSVRGESVSATVVRERR